VGLFSQKRYLDGDRIDIGGAAVRLKVSGRARRVSLRLDAARGEISLHVHEGQPVEA